MKNRMLQRVRRWLAMMMCAVMVAGMAPETLTAALMQDVSKVYAEPEKTVTINPGAWFPAALSAGATLEVHDDEDFTADDEAVTGHFMGFYFDRNYDFDADTTGNEEVSYYDFKNNQSYYAFFRVYGGYDDENDEYIGFGGTVKIGTTTLQKYSDEVYYLKMSIGTPVKHKLYINCGDRAELLPEELKNGIEFEEGDSLYSVLDRLFEDVENMRSDDGYVVTAWKCGDITDEDLGDFKETIHYAVADVTITAVWTKEVKATGVDFKIAVPKPGTTDRPYDDYDEEQLYTDYRGSVYTDESLETPLADDEVYEEGYTYYRKYYIRVRKGYYIDDEDLPQITVNGEAFTLTYDESDEGWYFIWAFKPEFRFYSITLDYNYPDGTEYTHSITDIPDGTNIYDKTLDLLYALRYDFTAGDGITYDAYLEKAEEYENDSDSFYTKYKYVNADNVDRYICTDTVKTQSSFTSYQEYNQDYIPNPIESDMTLYLQWEQELESVELESVVVPECGQSYADYKTGLGDGNTEVTFESGITAQSGGFVVSDNRAMPLGDDTVFVGDNDFIIQLYGLAISDDEDGYIFFDSYISENTKIVYNEVEYDRDEDNNYYIPVTAEHVIPANVAPVRENEVAATCERAGSYDEVIRYECIGCHQGQVKVTPKTIQPLGHDWGDWTVVKEATETEDGLEERVCKRDPAHKETRVIPKKQKVEPEQPVTPVPDTKNPVVVSNNKTEKINDADVTIETDVTYPKAVTWTGSKITKAQLSALSKDGVIAAVKISGLDKAIAGLNKDADLSKLIKTSYVIGKKKNANAKGSFYVKLKLDSKVLKKAKIKGKDKKALEQMIKTLNAQFKDKPYEFNIVPVELKDAESISIKAKLKNGEVQVNEDGSIKGMKSLKIKVAVPGLKKGKTYSFNAKKAAKSFTIKVSADKKAEVTALAGQNFTGSRSGVEITK